VLPLYTYAEDGTNRRENITDWTLEQFRDRYGDRSITKWDIFHYVYAVLHHPECRQRCAANLRRELPRIPFESVGAALKGDGLGRPESAPKETLRDDSFANRPAGQKGAGSGAPEGVLLP